MKKSTIIIGTVLLLALVGGAIYLFTKSNAKETTTTTASQTDNKSGLSSLLGSLNLSGLRLF